MIATRVGGQEYLVADGTSGVLIEPEDPAELADAILQIRRDPELARRMGEAGRQLAQAYDWEKVTARTLDLYSTLIPTRSPK